MGSDQLALGFHVRRPAPTPPAVRADAPYPHTGAPCSNCDPARSAEHIAIIATCGDDWLRGCLVDHGIDVSACTPEEAAWERYHLAYRHWLFAEEVERRRTGGGRAQREETIAQARARRVPCSAGCGAQVHAGGQQLCRPCAQRAARAAASQEVHP